MNKKRKSKENIETADQVLPRGATPTQINVKINQRSKKKKKCNVILSLLHLCHLNIISVIMNSTEKKYLFAPFLHALEFSLILFHHPPVIIRVFFSIIYVFFILCLVSKTSVELKFPINYSPNISTNEQPFKRLLAAVAY